MSEYSLALVSTANIVVSVPGSTQSHGSISFPSVSQEAKSSIPLEKELEIAIQILTSHACSEDGLEHATTLLFHLSKTQVKLRPIIVRLLLQGLLLILPRSRQRKTNALIIARYARDRAKIVRTSPRADGANVEAS